MMSDPSFDQAFTATARSGSYGRAQRGQARVSQTMPPRASQLRSSGNGSSRIQQNEGSSSRHAAAHKPERHATRESVREKETLGHKIRAAKAERQFNKTFGADDPVKPSPDRSSRPALYEMKMGKNHKRSSRMHDQVRGKSKPGRFSRLGGFLSIFNPRSPRFSSRAFITCAALVVAVVLLYQPVANYYQEIRQQQQLQAEYEVVADYYSSLKSEVEYLNTREGLEEFVHQELGWIKPGEQVVSVEGLEARDATARQGSITSDLSDAVPTPETWYSPVLDVLLGYDKP